MWEVRLTWTKIYRHVFVILNYTLPTTINLSNKSSLSCNLFAFFLQVLAVCPLF